jgi:hypothetical protein
VVRSSLESIPFGGIDPVPYRNFRVPKIFE